MSNAQALDVIFQNFKTSPFFAITKDTPDEVVEAKDRLLAFGLIYGTYQRGSFKLTALGYEVMEKYNSFQAYFDAKKRK